MLHVAITRFCRPNTEQGGYQEQFSCVSKYIKDYAACIGETFGCSLLQLNVHQAACHLEWTCLQQGYTGNETELFIEQRVYRAKDRMKGISTTNLEYSMIKSV